MGPYPTDTSLPVKYLEAGVGYYLNILHGEGVGTNYHLWYKRTKSCPRRYNLYPASSDLHRNFSMQIIHIEGITCI